MTHYTGTDYLDRPFRPAAERILARAWDCPVRVDEGVTIGSAEEIKPNIRRCRVLEGPPDRPATVIAKRILGPGVYDPDDLRRVTEFDGMPSLAWQLCHEWAATTFLCGIPSEPPLSPRCLGGDRSDGLVVLEDIGTGPTLGELLEGADPAQAEQAVLGYAVTLGRLHARTIGRQAEFERLWVSLGFPASGSIPRDVAKPWRRFQEAGDALNLRLPAGFQDEMTAAVAALASPGPFLAFGHGENNPINNMLGGGRVRLFDFEFSDFWHALADGVNYRHLFPWRTHRLPDELLRRMEATYRAELVQGCPEAGDDAIYGRAFVAARAQWTMGHVCEHLFGDFGDAPALERDGFWEGNLTEAERAVKPTVRQRVLILLENLASTAEEFGQLPAIGAAALEMAACLRARWRPSEYQLPVYPAFRSA
jgi:hypothetical protein